MSARDTRTATENFRWRCFIIYEKSQKNLRGVPPFLVQELKGLAYASFTARLSRNSTVYIVDLLEGACPHACL